MIGTAASNQATRSVVLPVAQSSQIVQTPKQALSQTQNQQQNQGRKPVALAVPAQPKSTSKPFDPDSENEDQSMSDVKFECPRPDGLFADPSEYLRIF